MLEVAIRLALEKAAEVAWRVTREEGPIVAYERIRALGAK